MRIIAGKYRRRKLLSNPGDTTRPITDRVKEILFERMFLEFQEKRVADVFSGTGTIGLEALSRGASGVVFIEKDRKAHDLLVQNVRSLGAEDVTLCWRADVLRCSFRPRNVPHLTPFEVIFFDPPYKMVDDVRPGTPLSRALERLARPDVSTPDALLLFRTPDDARFEMPACWKLEETMDFSNMSMHIFRKADDGGATPEAGNFDEDVQEDSASASDDG